MDSKNVILIEAIKLRQKYLMDNDPHDFEWCCHESESEYFILETIQDNLIIKYDKSIRVCNDALSEILNLIEHSSEDNFLIDLKSKKRTLKKIKHSNKFLKRKKRLIISILDYLEYLFEDDYTYLEIYEFKIIFINIKNFIEKA